MQPQRFVILVLGTGAAFSQASGSSSLTLMPMDEPVTQLVSPSSAKPAVPVVQYSSNGALVVNLVTATPLLCANTAVPTTSPAVLINSIYYSAHGSTGTSPLPFVFGASSTTPAVSMQAAGATQVGYDGSQVQFAGDPLDALVCYGLDANGVHRMTRDLFFSDFEPAVFNSTAVVSVFHLPTNAADYYGYTIDVTIPPLPGGTSCSTNGLGCNFALVEGYDTSVFATANGQWCLAPAGAQSCFAPPPSGGTAPAYGNINLNYSNYPTTAFLAAPVVPALAKQYHFVAFRYFKQGVSALPASGAPVVMAALFSPLDLGENKLDDNVAVGNNQLANVAPGVVQDAAYTTFVAKLASLQENTDSGALTFDISDPDTVEPNGGPYLDATVNFNLPNGIKVPVTPNCTLNSTAGATPVNRSCTLNIALSKGSFWDASVDATYQGQFSNFATDVVDGTYAVGIAASAQIVVIDSAGKSSMPLSSAIHVNSIKNDPPIVTFGTAMPSMSDPKQSGTLYPTYSCSVSANSCGATFHVVDLVGVITLQPGPEAAFDELASQSTAVNDVQCGQLEEANPIFANAPVVTPISGSQTNYDVTFQLIANVSATGSSLCKATFTDVMQAFPNGESAVTTDSYFRVVVNQ